MNMQELAQEFLDLTQKVTASNGWRPREFARAKRIMAYAGHGSTSEVEAMYAKIAQQAKNMVVTPENAEKVARWCAVTMCNYHGVTTYVDMINRIATLKALSPDH